MLTGSYPSSGDDPSMPSWREVYKGGSAEAEQAHFEELARTIMYVQQVNERKSHAAAPLRTLHAKIVVGVVDAELLVDNDLPSFLQAGYFTAGTSYRTTVRLSNASGTLRSDAEPDVRGAALKISVSASEVHDLLMTSYPVSHARNADQFVEVARIGSGNKALVLPRMLLKFGPSETLRIVHNLKHATRTSASLALESYWSRGAILWGDAGPVRFQLSPLDPLASPEPVPADDPNRLRLEFAARLRHAAVQFRLCVQKFVNETTTPIEDGAIEWKELDAPWIPVATLTIPQQDLLSDSAQTTRQEVDKLAFNPWNTTPEFRPLGNLNRARRIVYSASAKAWQQ